jgi:hypothetical protein
MDGSKLVSVSVWVYRGLLFAYPRSFRREYGEAMAQVFRDLCLRGRETSLARVWGRALLDFVVSLVSEYMNRGAEMTRSKWIQLSGWGLAASGFLFFLGFLAASRPVYSPYNAASWSIDPFLNAHGTNIIALSMLLMSAGMAGLLGRFGSRAGETGQTGLVLGITGGLVGAVGAVGLGIVDAGPWWNIFFFSLTAVILAMVLFGIACLRRRLFTRWNGVWLAGGAVFLLFIVANMALSPWQAPEALIAVMFILFALAMALVGYRLLSETDGRQVSAV